MSAQKKNVRVSFKLSQEAAIQLREIALTRSELLCNLGVLAVQLGNESQICISSPLSFNFAASGGAAVKQKATEEGLDESELTDSAGDLSENEKLCEEEAVSNVGIRDVDQAVALATAASVKVSTDDPSSELETSNKASLSGTERRTNRGMEDRNARTQEIYLKKSKKENVIVKQERADDTGSVIEINSQEVTHGNDSSSPNVNKESNKFDGPSGVSFAQHLINLSKQYRSENEKSPTSNANDKYFANDASQIVGRDHVLRYFNEKPDDYLALNVNNPLLFDSYEASAVKSAEELSKEQSEMSPTVLDSMSVSSADSLFEEARLGSVDELRLSPSSVPVSTQDSSHSNSSSPSESAVSDSHSPTQSEKLKRTMKFQKLLKGQTGIVCELCMHPVQKSYSCFKMAHAPKEIMHLFDDGSSCVRVCRRCLPYKSPKSHHDKHGHKKARKTTDNYQHK